MVITLNFKIILLPMLCTIEIHVAHAWVLYYPDPS